MEMDTAESLEEQLRLAGVPAGWGQLDLSQLRSPSPPRAATQRSARRLSGIQPCSSHRMTLRRRSGFEPLSPVERSLDALQLGDGEAEEPEEEETWSTPRATPATVSALTPASALALAPAPVSAPVSALSPAPAPADVSSPQPPPQIREEPASARRPSRRRSLVPLNAPTAPVSGRKSRRRSFGGRGAAEMGDGDFADPPQLCDGAGKENGWLGGGESHSPPAQATQTGLKRSLAAFEADSLAVPSEQWRGQSGVAGGSGAAVVPAPVLQDCEDAETVADKSRRPAAARRQRRRSAGGLRVAPAAESVSPQEPADSPTGDLGPLSSAAAPAGWDFTTAAAAAAAAAPPAISAQPEEADFSLPPELENFYFTHRNYEPPAPRGLPTIAEEEEEAPAPAPARPVRGVRRRTDLDKVRKCAMELTPAKQRLRKLKAQRVSSLNKARSRKGRACGKKVTKLLDERLRELDLFYQEEEKREVRAAEEERAARAAEEEERAARLVKEEASVVSCAAAQTVAGASGEGVHAKDEPMEVEMAPPSSPPPPPPSVATRTPPSSTRYIPPPSLMSAPSPSRHPAAPPLFVPDLDATWTGSLTPRRGALTAADADSTLGSSGDAGLLLELTHSSIDSPLSPVIAGGGALELAALRRPGRFSDAEEASPCLGGRLNRAVLLSPGEESA